MKYYAYIILVDKEIYSWGMSFNEYFPNEEVDNLPFAKNAYIALKNFCESENISKTKLTFYDNTKNKVNVIRYKVSDMKEFHDKTKKYQYISKFKGKKIEELI